MPDSDKPGKRSKPDGTPGKGRAGKGRTFGSRSEDRPPFKSRKPFEAGRSDSYKPRPYKGNHDDKPSWKKDKEGDSPRERRFSDKPSGDRPYKSRKPFEGAREGSDKSRPYKGNRDDKPSWLRDKEGDAPRERRFSDKPSGDRPYKSRKPFEGGRDDSDKSRPYKGNRDDKPSWLRDKEGDAPREKRFSDKPSGDRPYKSRKPFEGGSEDSDKSRPYKGNRDDKPSWLRDKEGDAPREKRFSDKPSGERPYKSRKPFEEGHDDSDKSRPYKGNRDDKPSWLRDKEGDAPRESRYSDKPSGDRPYRGKRSDDAPYEPRSYRKDNDGKPQRPRKPEDESDAPRERRARTTDDRDGRPRRREDSEFRPKRRFDDKEAPRGFGHGKSGDSPKHKGEHGFSKDGTIRLNKFIANSGVCSRREADNLIESGVVSVNGEVVTELGTKVTRDDKVQFDGQTLNIEKKVYLLLNKPKGYITTVDDPQERDTVMKLIKDACRERIYPVGRLDRNTSGLLLFTNDGELAKKLTHPGHKVRKVYHVELDKALAKSDMTLLAEGVDLEDGHMAVDEIAYTGSNDDKKNIGVVIHSGRNRIIRRLFETIDYEVVKLDRVAFGNLTKKDLPRGRWRMLEQSEINMLLMI